MRAFLRVVILALLMAVTAGCVYTWFSYDGSSPDPGHAGPGLNSAQVQASKTVNQ
jgi:hypothetical protein